MLSSGYHKKVVFKEMRTLSPPSSPLEACLFSTHDQRIDVQPGGERDVYTQIVDIAPPFPP